MKPSIRLRTELEINLDFDNRCRCFPPLISRNHPLTHLKSHCRWRTHGSAICLATRGQTVSRTQKGNRTVERRDGSHIDICTLEHSVSLLLFPIFPPTHFPKRQRSRRQSLLSASMKTKYSTVLHGNVLPGMCICNTCFTRVKGIFSRISS